MIERIGQGIDVHAFIPEGEAQRPLILGGIEVPGPGLVGHTDADVLLHAIVDALLGAVAKGDIGTLVGVDAPETKDSDSADFIAAALKETTGYRIVNIDCTIIAQAPKMMDYIPAMRANIAKLLVTNLEDVSVKATTTDRLGFLGNKEGIAVSVIVGLGKALPWDGQPRKKRTTEPLPLH